MLAPGELAYCHDMIRTGSYSFHAASRLLPQRVRDPALVLYAFCRLADDAVDEGDEKGCAVLSLEARLDHAYAGRPLDTPVDRAFAAMIEAYDMPRALPEAWLEGFAWDAVGRRYATLSDVRAYSARVASAVGAMMTVLMGVRDADALARACDLGVAMQLTNIARDVGEDARARRIYLPLEWLDEAQIDPETFFHEPLPTPAVRRMVRRLLSEARRLYLRAEPGVTRLPVDCRAGIFAARHIYAGIGSKIAACGHDSISNRARTSGAQKLGWIARSILRSGLSLALPQSAVLYAPPLPETRFLVDAAARPSRAQSRSVAVLDILSQLRTQEAMRATPAE
ncbi:MAG: phytoene/squalene synthase family protein [Pseudomonadota bacterium]